MYTYIYIYTIYIYTIYIYRVVGTPIIPLFKVPGRAIGTAIPHLGHVGPTCTEATTATTMPCNEI